MLAKLVPVLAIVVLAAVLWLIFPFGFPNYDTIYMLVWGQELAAGVDPDLGAPLAPTPHPLAELFGLITEPLEQSAVGATMVVAYTALAAVGYLVYRLGALWFDRAIGLVAAAIVLTRAPFLSNGLRAYVDLPYIALVLAALVIETRRARAGWPVLALLAIAGLLRPEAWLFAAAYLVYLALTLDRSSRSEAAHERDAAHKRDSTVGAFRKLRLRFSPTVRSALRWRRERERQDLVALAALAAAGPLLWAIFDWVTAGDPLYSFSGTRDTVETLERETGPVDVVLYGPRRLGEVLQWPGIVGAIGGAGLCLALLRPRAVLGVAAATLALAAFAVLGSVGLAVIPRYTMLAAAILAVFCAAGLLGWRLLEVGHRWRTRWRAFAALVAAMFVLWGPNQLHLLDNVYADLDDQSRVEDDLEDLTDSGAFEPLCLPISVPNHRAVPRLAFHLDLRPSSIVSSTEQRQPPQGYFLAPADEFAIENFLLDPNDPARLETEVPPGFRKVAANDSWLLYARCRN